MEISSHIWYDVNKNLLNLLFVFKFGRSPNVNELMNLFQNAHLQ